MTSRFDRKLLAALTELGGTADTLRLHRKLDDGRFWPLSLGKLYASLDRLEKAGLIQGYMGMLSYPERGNRRRRYYKLVT